jgi:hypothetical protein
MWLAEHKGRYAQLFGGLIFVKRGVVVPPRLGSDKYFRERTKGLKADYSFFKG